jgi:hypothetical protein
MNKTKLILILILLINFSFLLFPTVKAVTIPCPLPVELCDGRSALNTLSALILPVAALVLLLVLVYAGFTKLTAAGDAEKEKKAMQIIQAAVIGFAIIALAGVIVGTIGGFFGFKLFPT